VDTDIRPASGTISLIDIDWHRGAADNIGMRNHPHLCDKGIGSAALTMMQAWWLDHDLKGLRLDVAATNRRAVACYKKAGFRETAQVWREAPDLVGADLNDPKYAFLKGHVRFQGDGAHVRFYWMEWNR
jgi:RimJ/RimL family protein N-acetyltransferase